MLYGQDCCKSTVPQALCDRPEATQTPASAILVETQKLLGEVLQRLLVLDGHISGSRPQPNGPEAGGAGCLLELASQIRSSAQAAGILADRISAGLIG